MKSIWFIVLASLLNTGTAAAEIQYYLIPGYTTTGFTKGWEASLIRSNDQYEGGMGGGVVFGRTLKPDPEMFVEAQLQSWAMLMWAGSLGAGGYQTERTRGIQATIATQFYTPFLIFIRLKLDVSPKVKAPRPMLGLMFKLPIPVANQRN